MTIKRIASSIALSSVVASSLFAGTLAVTGVAQTAGVESTLKDKSSFSNVDVNTSYTVTINGTLNQGSIIYSFTGADLNSTDAAKHKVWDSTLGDFVTDVCANGSSGRFICDLNGSTITDGDVLVLDNNSTDTVSTLHAGLMDFNTSAGFSGLTVSATLTNSATTTIDTGSAVTLISTISEWSAAVVDKFVSQIDASASFLSFHSDANATIKVTQSAPTLGSQTLVGIWSVMPDQNVSTFGTFAQTGATTQGIDSNYTAATIAAAGTYHAKFTPNGTSVIKEAKFTTGMTALFGTNTVNLIASGTDFGGFTTYGYNANIPAASYSAGVTDTVINIVNNQTAATADMVMVITDATANTCTLTSTSDTEVAKPAANSTTKYKLSEMLANTKCSALTGTLYSIQATLPTTPSNVFGQAAVVRTDSASGISKVLPVYNNGTKY